MNSNRLSQSIKINRISNVFTKLNLTLIIIFISNAKHPPKILIFKKSLEVILALFSKIFVMDPGPMDI